VRRGRGGLWLAAFIPVKEDDRGGDVSSAQPAASREERRSRRGLVKKQEKVEG